MNRRSFMLKGAAAAAMMAAPQGLLSEEGDGEGQASEPGKPVAPLPPPPGRQVYLDRMAKARELLRDAGAAALVDIPGANLRYLTGLDLDWTAPLVLFVLPLEGPCAIFAPETDRELIESGPVPIDDLRLWTEDENPPRLLEKYIKKGDLDDKTICVGERIWYSEFFRLHSEFTKMKFISTSGIVEREREHKSIQEVAIIESASGIAESAIEQAWPEVRQGITEEDLAWVLDSRVREMGAVGDCGVLFGKRTANPRYPSGRAALVAGDVIRVTSQASVHGYWARVSRAAVLGKPTGRMKSIHETLRRAQELAREQARPEAACAVLELRARGAIGSAAFLKFYRGRLGAGLGLTQQERPYISRGYHERMADGQIATIEPGLYTPGDYGLQLGDVFAVTLTGSRWLTTPSKGVVEL